LNTIKIIVTDDGSHSLLNEALDETYHSRHGAIQESLYVFIEQGLNYVAEKQNPESISILEVGFGTGLNALLTVSEAIKKSISVAYTSLETFPLGREVWENLNYPDSHNLYKALHQAGWQNWHEINSHFRLLKLEKSLQAANLEPLQFDLIYFDAFAPSKQPEMWELPILEKVVNTLKSGGVFVTYCAKGQLKRDLKSLGLIVESLPGPPGKREMVRALKPDSFNV
jgi:tRNA U34 5-methylaminomethyl-2-thiouridine-forming methyltransferase MnmC